MFSFMVLAMKHVVPHPASETRPPSPSHAWTGKERKPATAPVLEIGFAAVNHLKPTYKPTRPKMPCQAPGARIANIAIAPTTIQNPAISKGHFKMQRVSRFPLNQANK